jgi:hypothetical protein
MLQSPWAGVFNVRKAWQRALMRTLKQELRITPKQGPMELTCALSEVLLAAVEQPC